MPNVSPSFRWLGRFGDLFLPCVMAIAVSFLFSAMPFGNPTAAFMPAIPGPSAVATEASPTQWAAGASLLSSDSNWDYNGQVVWATLNDVHPLPILCAALESLRLSLLPIRPGSRYTCYQRPPPRFTNLLFHLRAPPRHA